MKNISVLEFGLLIFYKRLKVTKSVRNAISKLNLIIGIFRCEFEGKPIRSFICFKLKLLKTFRNFFCIFGLCIYSTPSNPFLLFHLWLHIRLHSSWVKTFWFLKVTNVKFICGLLKILHFKVKPMKMTPRIAINSHEQIIFVLAYLYLIHFYLKNTVQVSWFKKRIKNQVLLSFCIPVLPTEIPIRNLYVFWWVHMWIRKLEIFVVPGIICAFVTSSKITQFNFILLPETTFSKIQKCIELIAFEGKWDGLY